MQCTQVISIDERLVSGWTDRSFVLLLNNGASTLLCGRECPFFRILLCPPSTQSATEVFTESADSMLKISSVSLTSEVIPYSFLVRMRCLTVSYAAERSTKGAPVIFLFSNLSSMNCVRFRSCPVHDFSGLKPACSQITWSSKNDAMQLWRRRWNVAE